MIKWCILFWLRLYVRVMVARGRRRALAAPRPRYVRVPDLVNNRSIYIPAAYDYAQSARATGLYFHERSKGVGSTLY